MSSGARVPLQIYKGKTFTKVFRWGQPTKVYKSITAATQAAPCVITATGHGLTEGWAYRIVNAKGMVELNSLDGEYYKAKVLSANTLELNDLVSTDLSAYTSGGLIVYNEPVDLSAYTARLQIRETIDATTTLVSLTSPSDGIVVDNTAKTITVSRSAIETAAYTFESGAVYDLEMVVASTVHLLAYGTVTVVEEVTR